MRRALKSFIALESAGGIVLLFATVAAIACANSPLADAYHTLLTMPLLQAMDAGTFIKDVLMAIFFFAVGMELKHEMRDGALAAPGQKILPAIAALGGVIVPALIYLAVTHSTPGAREGWAIPTATDIAFALCVVRLIGGTVPHAAKMYLLAIAIYDDLLAILIIAVFYASGFHAFALIPLAALCLTLLVLNRYITHPLPYLITGILLWFALHHASIHPTVAGVLTGIAIPMRNTDGRHLLSKLLHRLHPYVAFFILPLFAFSSAGVSFFGITADTMNDPIPYAIALGLLFGKQTGILAATYAAVRLKLSPLPSGMDWRIAYAIATIAGIGFTMSLFIGQLALPPSEQDAVRLGVLGGSLLSAGWGALLLRARRIP